MTGSAGDRHCFHIYHDDPLSFLFRRDTAIWVLLRAGFICNLYNRLGRSGRVPHRQPACTHRCGPLQGLPVPTVPGKRPVAVTRPTGHLCPAAPRSPLRLRRSLQLHDGRVATWRPGRTGIPEAWEQAQTAGRPTAPHRRPASEAERGLRPKRPPARSRHSRVPPDGTLGPLRDAPFNVRPHFARLKLCRWFCTSPYAVFLKWTRFHCCA